MQLPEALQPWRQWLQGFSAEQLPLFTDLLARLNPLLGPLRGRHQGGVPEPDGLGDLQRRGPYEHLLSSEWLLADEVPDEFLRRAATGEHVFVAPHYRARMANRLIVVLFDAGPSQLGWPRLVHLALLILLARRAREAGAELRWGILQQVPQLYELNGTAQLKQLLQARTFHTVNDEHWQAWRLWLAEHPWPAGECWIVGQRLPATDKKLCTHRVQLQRSLDGHSLTFDLQAAASRHVELPNPDERLALQILHGEFDTEQRVAPPTVKGNLPHVFLAPIISSAGSHVALRMLDEPGIVTIKLPGKKQKKTLAVRRSYWSASSTPLAVVFPKRSPGVIMSKDQTLLFWNMPGVQRVKKPDRETLQLQDDKHTHLPAVWLRNTSSGRLLLVDERGYLASWVIGTGKTPTWTKAEKVHILADNVLGLTQVCQDVVAYMRRDADQLYVHSVDAEGTASPAHAVGSGKRVTEVLLAAGPVWRQGVGGYALRRGSEQHEQWEVVAPNGSTEHIDLAPGWHGLGLLFQGNDERCSLVLHDYEKGTVALYSAGQQRVLFTPSEMIARLTFCPLNGLIAAMTFANELLVYSVPLEQMCLQLLCNQTLRGRA